MDEWTNVIIAPPPLHAHYHLMAEPGACLVVGTKRGEDWPDDVSVHLASICLMAKSAVFLRFSELELALSCKRKLDAFMAGAQ